MADHDAIATALEEAADLLLIRGVERGGKYGDVGGPRCVMGALFEVCDVERNGYGSVRLPEKTIEARILADGFDPQGNRPVVMWNDRSADDFEVIDTLRSIAKDIRNGEADRG